MPVATFPTRKATACTAARRERGRKGVAVGCQCAPCAECDVCYAGSYAEPLVVVAPCGLVGARETNGAGFRLQGYLTAGAGTEGRRAGVMHTHTSMHTGVADGCSLQEGLTCACMRAIVGVGVGWGMSQGVDHVAHGLIHVVLVAREHQIGPSLHSAQRTGSGAVGFSTVQGRQWCQCGRHSGQQEQWLGTRHAWILRMVAFHTLIPSPFILMSSVMISLRWWAVGCDRVGL